MTKMVWSSRVSVLLLLFVVASCCIASADAFCVQAFPLVGHNLRHRHRHRSNGGVSRPVLAPVPMLTMMVNGTNDNDISNAAHENPPSPYYTYKQFKRWGVPAMMYSLLTNLIAKLFRLIVATGRYRGVSSGGTISTATGTISQSTHDKTDKSIDQNDEDSNIKINGGDAKRRRKVALVTGSNTGVGFETAKSLVHDHGYEVIIACRSVEKGWEACTAINGDGSGPGSGGRAVVLDTAIDLSDLDSVRKFANAVNQQYDKIDVLINNAGRNSAGPSSSTSSSSAIKSSPPYLGENEELDTIFTTNFLGHFLLTNLLFPKLDRIINLSSVMHHFPFYDSDDEWNSIECREYWRNFGVLNRDTPATTVRKTYAPSKLAALLFSVELNRRYNKSHGIRSIAVNPGAVNSDIWRNYSAIQRFLFRQLYLTPQQGSTTSVAAATLDLDGGDKDSNEVVYIQPYWIPKLGGSNRLMNNVKSLFSFRRKKKTSSSSSSSTAAAAASTSIPPSPPFPMFEMLGPYVGFRATTPRLPLQDKGTTEACRHLFGVCEELAGVQFEKVESVSESVVV